VVQTTDGETCDGTAGSVGSGCRTDCTSCGDGVLQVADGETCDGTAGSVGTGCRADCSSCGDGVLQVADGETCDGTAGSVGTGCRSDCTSCGDGVLQVADGETCDGTAGSVGTGCRSDCTSCGDGVLQASHGETCDGTAGTVGSGCRTDCTSCGDSVVQASHGETCDPPGSAAGGNGQNCRSDCTVCGDGVIQAADGETCDDGSPTATCNDVCQPAQKVCPFANPAFGPASGCTVLNFGGSFTSTGPAGQYQGNVCIGDSATVGFSGDNFVAGDLNLGPDATCKEHCDSKHVQGTINHNVDLSTEIQGCENARENNTPASLGGSGPECTESTAKLQSLAVNGTITRLGVNIICLTADQQIKGLKLAGDATTKYTFIVEGKLKFQDGKIETVAPVGPDDVLWLFVGDHQELRSSGGGGGTNCCKAVIDGSVIIDGTIALAPGLINGQVCGTGNWSFVSGSGVHCPDP